MSTVVETPGRTQELVRSTVAGSPDALAELYRRHADLVYRVAFRLLANAADAEDVLQDVFGGLPEALRHFSTPAYWIVDGSGTIRFEETSLADIRRQVAALLLQAPSTARAR